MKMGIRQRQVLLAGLLLLTTAMAIWTAWYLLLLGNLVWYDWLISRQFRTVALQYLSMPTYKMFRSVAWIGMAFMLGIMVKILLIGIVLIPSASMEKTLLTGDVVLVNKLCYGPILPHSIAEAPFGSLFFKKKTRRGNWAPKKLQGYAAIERNDVVVFKRHSHEKQMVKRVIGMPGEEIEIRNDTVILDQSIIPPSPTAKARPVAFNVSKSFPHVFEYNWTTSDFGPLKIPKKGESIDLSLSNIDLYKEVIQHFENKTLTLAMDGIYIDDQLVNSYTFEENYYFVMGDNRSRSWDSRFFGFVPEKAVSGKATWIISSSAQQSNKHQGKRFLKKVQ